MHIVIIHYHLHPGGVTRVIESQINALGGYIHSKDLEVHTGEALSHRLNCSTEVKFKKEESLNYLDEGMTPEEMNFQLKKISGYLEQLARKNDILHFHNLNLGKNPLLTLAAKRLAGRGVKIVNHCHDFAEDRPGNYAFLESVIKGFFNENSGEVLYPPYRNYHYAVLTSADYQKLKHAGIEHNRISLLPNPVTFRFKKNKEGTEQAVRAKFGIKEDQKICIYPVRAIHRKNIGEFILLSVLFRKQASWLLTQPPKNPAEIPEYNRWKTFCNRLEIPVIFEAGTIIDFDDLIPAADLCITTSMLEGFGLAFMEPWLAGVPVAGRKLENCTEDLTGNGIRFPLLYDRFIVTFKTERTDFKDLNQTQQQNIIKDIIRNPLKETEIRKLNPFLNDFFKPVPEEMIESNRQIIAAKYSPEVYGQQLYGLYKKLSGGS